MSDQVKQQGARTSALRIVGALLLVTLPFGWSVYASYRDFKDYVYSTLEAPDEVPIWAKRSLTADDCVTEALDWVQACPGFEEFCRRAIPTAVGTCLASRDRRAWCQSSAATLKRTSYGYDACREHVASARIEDSRLDRQRCAIAYRAVADWCEAQPPPPQARILGVEP